jgi:hypothetical protein
MNILSFIKQAKENSDMDVLAEHIGSFSKVWTNVCWTLDNMWLLSNIANWIVSFKAPNSVAQEKKNI